MNIIDVIHEQEANDAFLLGEEFGTMANFYKIGKYVVNLDNVTEMHLITSICIGVSFGDNDDYLAIRKNDEPDAFVQLMTWMDERPMLLSDEEDS